VTRRPAQVGDEAFLRALFAESRPDFAMLPPDMLESMLDLQVRAQRQHYLAAYPDATQEIIVADGADVGRLILSDSDTEMRVVDVTVGAAYRGQGIASTALREVLDDAGRRGLAVGLSVWSANTEARRLYDRLGFKAVSCSDDGYQEMQRPVAARKEAR
jgi:ribosomal protein S18 acetylase RimI-like enzyme